MINLKEKMVFQKHCLYLPILLVFFIFTGTKAQISHGGIPMGMRMVKSMVAQIVDMPALDSLMIQQQQKQSGRNRLKNNSVGYTFDVDIKPSSQGNWTTSNNIRVWSVQVRSEGALAIGVVFNNFCLKPDEKIFIYNEHEVLGAYTSENNLPSKILAVTPIEGEMATIEFSTPNSIENQGSFGITKIAHLFKSVSAILQEPDTCHINIDCVQGQNWQKAKRAVCKLMVYGNGTYYCTGTLINNTEGNAKAYLLTANHCFDHGTPEQTIFYFNHESADCSSKQTVLSQSLSGASSISSLYETDFSLLELFNHPPAVFQPYYAGWSLESGSNMDTVVTIHHPWGGVKKITESRQHPATGTFYSSDDPSPRKQNAFWQIIKWNYGTTEGGSSGGALFDVNHRIIGTLTGGDATCSSPYNDYYEKFSESYDVQTLATPKLSTFLNPKALNIQNLDGLEPYLNTFSHYDTSSNIKKNESVKQIPFEYGTGYYTGHNSAKITSYAEKFYAKKSTILTGVIINVAKKGNSGGIIFQIQTGTSVPESVKYEAFIPFYKMKATSKNYIEIYPTITVKGNYYVTYTISYSNSDSFSVYQAAPRYMANDVNTSFLKPGNTWKQYNDYDSHWATSIDISTITTDSSYISTSPSFAFQNISVFPCPARNSVSLTIPENTNNIQRIEVCDLSGKTVPVNYSNSNNQIELNIIDFKEGLYLLKIQTNKGIYTSKFIKVQ